jgi:hypothetical protein
VNSLQEQICYIITTAPLSLRENSAKTNSRLTDTEQKDGGLWLNLFGDLKRYEFCGRLCPLLHIWNKI